jgi:hypothetical protein
MEKPSIFLMSFAASRNFGISSGASDWSFFSLAFMGGLWFVLGWL